MALEVSRHGKTKESIKKEIERLENQLGELFKRLAEVAQNIQREGPTDENKAKKDALDARIKGVEEEIRSWEGEPEK